MCTGDAGPEQSLVLVSLLEDSKDPAFKMPIFENFLQEYHQSDILSGLIS